MQWHDMRVQEHRVRLRLERARCCNLVTEGGYKFLRAYLSNASVFWIIHPRPGSYHVWLLPEPWMDASSPPFAEVGRQRSAAVHYPAVHGPASDEAVRLLARVVAAAFATHIGASCT